VKLQRCCFCYGHAQQSKANHKNQRYDWTKCTSFGHDMYNICTSNIENFTWTTYKPYKKMSEILRDRTSISVFNHNLIEWIKSYRIFSFTIAIIIGLYCTGLMLANYGLKLNITIQMWYFNIIITIMAQYALVKVLQYKSHEYHTNNDEYNLYTEPYINDRSYSSFLDSLSFISHNFYRYNGQYDNEHDYDGSQITLSEVPENQILPPNKNRKCFVDTFPNSLALQIRYVSLLLTDILFSTYFLLLKSIFCHANARKSKRGFSCVSPLSSATNFYPIYIKKKLIEGDQKIAHKEGCSPWGR